MFDSELLQLIRQEVVTFAGHPQLSAHLNFIDPDMLQKHIECLYLTGQLSGSARLDDGRLVIQIEGLTPQGVQKLHQYEGQMAGRRSRQSRPSGIS